jgi:antitoxin (DNA-binding transcriptional repressor) of toxin-antitoxin stability system
LVQCAAFDNPVRLGSILDSVAVQWPEEANDMSIVTIQDAQAKLAELIHGMAPGEELHIIENDRMVAKLVVTPQPQKKPRQLGTMRGTVLSMEHFDDLLEEFEEYM